MTGVEDKFASSKMAIKDSRQTWGMWFSKFARHVFVAIVATFCLFSSNIPILTGIAFVLIAWIFVDFVQNSSQCIKLDDAILLLAGTQWLIMAHWAYVGEYGSDSTRMMQIAENEYMYNTLLAYIGYFLGLKIFMPVVIWNKEERVESEAFWNIALRIGIVLFAVSLFFPSFFTLLGRWIIVGYLLKMVCYHPEKKKYIGWLAALDGFLLVRAILSSMFHDLLLMLLMQLMFIAVTKKFSAKTMCAIIFSGIVLVNALQISKDQYRTVMDYYSTGDRLRVFQEIIYGNLYKILSVGSEEEQSKIVMRYNQGWLISHVYSHMDGEFHSDKLAKFGESLLAIVFPRVLMPNKRISGGKANIRDFTAVVLTWGTSMNISTVGEGYAYFGRYGNFIFHVILGVILSQVLRLVMYWEARHGIGVFLIPGIFYLCLRAESDFLTAFNGMFKTLFFFGAILWYFNSRLRKTIVKKKENISGDAH